MGKNQDLSTKKNATGAFDPGFLMFIRLFIILPQI